MTGPTIGVLALQGDEMRERFIREARSAASLRHPNIITIYDIGEEGGKPFIAMEFIAGETLGQLVHRRAPLTLSRRIALMEQVCVGLAYAHRHGIVHRDVKPANLMISRDSGVLKVLDFGVAGRVDADVAVGGVRGDQHPRGLDAEALLDVRLDGLEQRADGLHGFPRSGQPACGAQQRQQKIGEQQPRRVGPQRSQRNALGKRKLAASPQNKA